MSRPYLLCRIAGQRAVIVADPVSAVVELEHIVPVPRAPRHVAGLAALRSQSVTAIDCHRALGLSGEDRSGNCAVVIAHDGFSYALLVDAVEDILDSDAPVAPVPAALRAGWQAASLGMIELPCGPALLLDPAVLVAGNRKVAA